MGMTRKEAKEIFLNRGFIDGVYDGNKWREACIVISEWLEQEPTTKNDLGVDCISRQAVVDMTGLSEWFDSSDSYNEFVFALSELPPVTPQEPRWTPTSERLPEEDGEYYATIYDTDENYQYTDIAELEDGIWQYKDYIKVLAWMPLPKAYREVEE